MTHSSSRKPAMALLAACFLGSAAIRIADPSSALAVEAARAATGAQPSDVSDGRVTPMEDAAELLAALKKRETMLTEREIQLQSRERVLEAASAKLEEQLDRVIEAEERLAETLAIADQAADKDVARLVAAYEAMDERRAGPIFENMEVSFAAGLISRMNGPSASSILSALSPEKAYAITVFIAGRNARAPKD